MAAALLFSAVIHVATVAFIMTHLLALATENHDAQFGVQRFTIIAGLFGLACGVVAMLFMLPLHSFGASLVAGLAVAVLAGAMLSLFSAVRPLATGITGRPWYRRPESLTFYGTFVFMQLIAFSFIVAELAGAGRGS